MPNEVDEKMLDAVYDYFSPHKKRDAERRAKLIENYQAAIKTDKILVTAAIVAPMALVFLIFAFTQCL